MQTTTWIATSMDENVTLCEKKSNAKASVRLHLFEINSGIGKSMQAESRLTLLRTGE
jgi:hypothetical protein